MANVADMASIATAAASTASQDFTWTAAGAWSVFLALVALIIRQVGPWRSIAIGSEQKFRNDLMTANKNLTDRVEKLERAIEKKDALHSAERALDRHRLNNVTQCFDALLLMLKRAPEKVADIIRDIEEMRARQLVAEATEKATIQAELVRQTGEDVKLEET